jgi:hypothetical protein
VRLLTCQAFTALSTLSLTSSLHASVYPCSLFFTRSSFHPRKPTCIFIPHSPIHLPTHPLTHLPTHQPALSPTRPRFTASPTGTPGPANGGERESKAFELLAKIMVNDVTAQLVDAARLFRTKLDTYVAARPLPCNPLSALPLSPSLGPLPSIHPSHPRPTSLCRSFPSFPSILPSSPLLPFHPPPPYPPTCELVVSRLHSRDHMCHTSLDAPRSLDSASL